MKKLTLKTSSVRIKIDSAADTSSPLGMGDLVSAASLARNLMRAGLFSKMSTLVRIVPLTFASSTSATILLTASLAISIASAVIRIIEISTGKKIDLLKELTGRNANEITLELLILIYKNDAAVRGNSSETADILIEVANALGSRGFSTRTIDRVLKRVNENSLNEGRYLWRIPISDGIGLGHTNFRPWNGTTIIGPPGTTPYSIPAPPKPSRKGGKPSSGIFDEIQLVYTMLA